MRKLSQKQVELLSLVRENPNESTSQLATARGDRQAYETNLRDRLFRLYNRGLINATEKVGRQHPNLVVRREWRITEAGLSALEAGPAGKDPA